jgi:hypothetical protein
MISVCLTVSELKICNYVGRYRHHITSKHAEDQMMDKSIDPIIAAIQGVVTEYAVSKYLNLHFDMNCEIRKFGADLISHTGKTIEVKSTTRADGNLNAKYKSGDKPCDVFVLTQILSTHVIGIVGWVKREKFLIDANKRIGLGNEPYYTLSQTKLIGFHELNDKEALW